MDLEAQEVLFNKVLWGPFHQIMKVYSIMYYFVLCAALGVFINCLSDLLGGFQLNWFGAFNFPHWISLILKHLKTAANKTLWHK